MYLLYLEFLLSLSLSLSQWLLFFLQDLTTNQLQEGESDCFLPSMVLLLLVIQIWVKTKKK